MKKIIAIGNALVDVLALLHDEKLLSVLNLQKGGMTLVDEEVASRIEEALRPFAPSRATGGSAANTALALAGLQAQPTFVGTVGQDEMGDFFAQSCLERGIRPHLNKAAVHTGVAYTLITPDGERTFGTCLGAAALLKPEDIELTVMEGYGTLHMEGYLIQDRALVEAIAFAAKEAGLRLSVDLASPNIVESFRDEFRWLVREYADIVFANEEESMAYTLEDSAKTALDSLARECSIAVVKCGSRGAMARRGGETASVKARHVSVTDTTGAGDFFAGGFLYALETGASLEQSLRLGACLSESVIQVAGTTLPVQEWEFLRRQARIILGE